MGNLTFIWNLHVLWKITNILAEGKTCRYA